MASSPDESNPLDADEQAASLNGEAQDEAADAPTTDASTDSSPNDAPSTDDAAGERSDAETLNEEADDVTLSFQDDALDEKLAAASYDALNQVDFGIIQVDDDGEILFFNQYESELSGVLPEDAVGQNFFTEVAPCTNNRLFRGRFKKGLHKSDLDETFTYTYTYRMRPTLVTIHLYRDTRGDNWIMVQKF
ncbi:MAG: PAS domain-containing protein [Longimonas sp.]|uniref:PAS domain-containing protein n=1 Tax=Longimonas sp. TaxID=2039626 RepID=UPI003975CC34